MTGRMDHSDTTEDPHRETKYRPGPNPHCPVCHRFGPHFITNRHPRSSPGIFICLHIPWESTTNLTTGHSVQLQSRVADIQTSATSGELTERVPIQDWEESANTDSSPVGRLPVTPTITEDPLRFEDPVMQISGTGHWF